MYQIFSILIHPPVFFITRKTNFIRKYAIKHIYCLYLSPKYDSSGGITGYRKYFEKKKWIDLKRLLLKILKIYRYN